MLNSNTPCIIELISGIERVLNVLGVRVSQLGKQPYFIGSLSRAFVACVHQKVFVHQFISELGHMREYFELNASLDIFLAYLGIESGLIV